MRMPVTNLGVGPDPGQVPPKEATCIWKRRQAGEAIDGDFSGDDDGGAVFYLLSNTVLLKLQPLCIWTHLGPHFRMFLGA